MIIDQLPSITLPVEDTDEMPIERGQLTYKINLADLLNSASADITVIAAEYDPTASYAVGDYCTHDGLFYICITPVTAEAWDSTKWEEVTVGEELQKAGGVYVGATEPTDENIKIWLDTDEPGMSAVSSVNGKTGAVVLDLDDIGFAKLLWTNASPTSSFAAQTITLDLSGYDMILIKLKYDNTVLYGYADCIGYQFAAKGETTDISLINGIVPDGLSGQNPYIHSRAATVGSTGIVFSAGYRKKISDTSVATAENTAAIPLAVYGIKGVS